MPDFQGQFIPDGRTFISKGVLTIGLGFDIRDSKDASTRKQSRDNSVVNIGDRLRVSN